MVTICDYIKRMAKSANKVVPIQQVESLIYLIRGQKVMVDSDRFPEDFMFRLSEQETEILMRSQIVIAAPANSSQSVTSSRKHRGLAYRPYAFTEQGIAMLSSVLRSPRAVQVNIEIMRAFVKVRQWLASNAELSRRLDALEKKYDARFKIVFDAIREMMKAPLDNSEPHKEIGFHTVKVRPENRIKAFSKSFQP